RPDQAGGRADRRPPRPGGPAAGRLAAPDADPPRPSPRPGPRPMNPTEAYPVALQTLRVLVPEFLILAVAIAMMTAGPFVRLPRRIWCATAAGALVAAL